MQIHEPIIIDIDIKKPSYLNQPQVTQNDSNTFIINIFDDGEPLDLTNVTTVSIAHTRLDRKTIVTNGTKTGTNQVKFIVDRPETSLTGRVDAVVQLYNADSRISTLSFSYKVNADPTNNYIPTESEKTLIEVVLGEGPLRIQEAIDAAEYATAQGDYATAKGNEAYDYAKTETDNAVNYTKAIADENKNVLLAPVANFSAIATTYPTPVFGSKVQTTDDGKIYRWNGSTWQYVEEMNSNILTDIQTKLSQSNQQTQTLTHGTSVINGEVASPMKVEFYGNTLISLGNSILSSLKKYVLADKKTKLKWADATVTNGYKIVGKDERPSIVRIANYEGKISGSTVENPHKAGRRVNTSLTSPTDVAEYNQTGALGYDRLQSLNGSSTQVIATGNGQYAQEVFSYNLIEEVERKIGKIPKSTVADKVQWLRDNVTRLTANWHGLGSSVGGNKATLVAWLSTAWSAYPSAHTNAGVSKLSNLLTDMTKAIDTNGFAHFLAYAEPSDGTTASTINTDYVELEIELKPTANFHVPKVPLFEIDQATYDKIGVSLLDADVEKMFPYVDSVQHVKNPVVKVDGANLSSDFYAWAHSSVATVKSPFELEINKTGNSQTSEINIPCFPNTEYTFSISGDSNSLVGIYTNDGNGNKYQNVKQTYLAVFTKTFTTGANDKNIIISLAANNNGLAVFKNPMLTLGNVIKPFVPRNPSYLYAETVLAGDSNKKDILFQDFSDSGKWKKQKVWELLDLEGVLDWRYSSNGSGFKRVYIKLLNSKIADVILLNNKGESYKNVVTSGSITDNYQYAHYYSSGETSNVLMFSISNAETGFTEAMTLTADLIKSYFQGWKYVGDGTTHSWVSLVDGSAPSTNTLAYVSTNKAPNFTPYKLTYQLATPKVEPVTVEGDLAIGGLAQAEVSSGIIVREKIAPVLVGDYYHINFTSSSASLLKNKVSKVIQINENGINKINLWSFGSANAYGNQRWYIHKNDFNATAEYTVTYEVLSKESFTTNLNEVKVTYSKNVRNALDDVVAKTSDINTTVSVNVRAIAELYKRVRTLEGV